mmetsp:Transcript_5102/g.12281  ORF Transcript_5102/g.12281 Transcript_5102/m.12281 type:complete len:279 (+) Transcript_5102:1981-2817(+)
MNLVGWSAQRNAHTHARAPNTHHQHGRKTDGSIQSPPLPFAEERMLLRRTHFLVPHSGSARHLRHGHPGRPLGGRVRHEGSVRVALPDRRVLGPLFLFQVRVGGHHRAQNLPVVLRCAVGVLVPDRLLGRLFAEVRYDLEGVALVDEILLAFRRVKHLLGVRADERVKKGIEGTLVGTVRLGVGLGPQDATESLGFLPPAPEVARDLHDDIGFGEIDGGVTDLGNADGSQRIGGPERTENGLAFAFRGFAVNQRSLQHLRVLFQRPHQVRKHNDLVAL